MIRLLLYLGKRGAIDRYVSINTPKVGSALGGSQQSVSRWLIRLRHEGMITRKAGLRGYLVQITPEGRDLLLGLRKELNNMVAARGKTVMLGKLVSGMLDGKYYLRLKEYAESIESKLGFKPYPGTLNIKLSSMEATQCKEKGSARGGVEIPGFKRGERVFGALKCFPCRIEGIKCAVLIPERSHYGSDIVEIISRHKLRDKLRLSDGDDVKVEVDKVCV